MARPIASFVVSIKDGTVHSQGSVAEVISQDRFLASETNEEKRILDKIEDVVDVETSATEEEEDGKLIVGEEIEDGHVSWPARKPTRDYSLGAKLTSSNSQVVFRWAWRRSHVPFLPCIHWRSVSYPDSRYILHCISRLLGKAV